MRQSKNQPLKQQTLFKVLDELQILDDPIIKDPVIPIAISPIHYHVHNWSILEAPNFSVTYQCINDARTHALNLCAKAERDGWSITNAPGEDYFLHKETIENGMTINHDRMIKITACNMEHCPHLKHIK